MDVSPVVVPPPPPRVPHGRADESRQASHCSGRAPDLVGESTAPAAARPRTEQTFSGTTDTTDIISIDDTIARLAGAGGTIVARKIVVPGVVWLAYFADTEGTVFGMMEADGSAA